MSDSDAMASEERDRLACTRCGTDVNRMDRFCRNCGLELRADAGAIEAYLLQILPGRVDAALKDRFKEQKIVEVETAELLAERAMKWLRAFGFFLGIPAVLLAAVFSFFGLKTYSDINRVAHQAADLEKQLAGPQQQLARVNQELVKLQDELASAKTTLGNQISQVGERQNSLEDQLKAIRSRLDFCPGSSLSAALKEQLQDGLSRFVVYLQGIGFHGLDDRVLVCVYSKEDPIRGELASQSDTVNAFYTNNSLYIHRAMSEDMSVALRGYAQHALMKMMGSQPSFNADVESALADYFPASFLGSALIGAKLGGLFKLPTPYIRNLDNSLTYGAVRDEPHHRGEVWAGALWACRQAVEQSAVDRAAFEAWKLAAQSHSQAEVAKRFGAGLAAAAEQPRQCLGQEITRRGLPH